MKCPLGHYLHLYINVGGRVNLFKTFLEMCIVILFVQKSNLMFHIQISETAFPWFAMLISYWHQYYQQNWREISICRKWPLPDRRSSNDAAYAAGMTVDASLSGPEINKTPTSSELQSTRCEQQADIVRSCGSTRWEYTANVLYHRSRHPETA